MKKLYKLEVTVVRTMVLDTEANSEEEARENAITYIAYEPEAGKQKIYITRLKND